MDFLYNAMGSALCPVATNREEDVDAALLQKIDDDVGADRPAEVPSNVPPSWWILFTISEFSHMGGLAASAENPEKP